MLEKLLTTLVWGEVRGFSKTDIPPVVKNIFHYMWLISSSLLHTWTSFAPFSAPTARFYALRLQPGLAKTSTQTPIS